MEPFRFCLAFEPLAIYLLVIGWINLRSKPFLISSGRDRVALGIGLAGIILVGPVELLLPQDAIDNFGRFVWILPGTLYVMVLLLLVVAQHPKLIAYNTTVSLFRETLDKTLSEMGTPGVWNGSSVRIPALGIEAHLEIHEGMSNVSLTALGDQKTHLETISSWNLLEKNLAQNLAQETSRPNAWGAVFLLVSLLMMAAVGWRIATQSTDIAQGFREMFHL